MAEPGLKESTALRGIPKEGRSSGILPQLSGLRTLGRPVLRRGDTPSTATPGPGQGFPRPYLQAGRLCSPRQGRASALKEGLRWPAGSSSSWPASSPSPPTSPARPRGSEERRVTPTRPSGRPQSARAGAAEPLRSRGAAGRRWRSGPRPRRGLPPCTRPRRRAARLRFPEGPAGQRAGGGESRGRGAGRRWSGAGRRRQQRWPRS